MSRVEKLLGVVSHPNVAYVLFLAGAASASTSSSRRPGAILPGVVGGISLLLALYAFSVLPVNLAGLALILFAILLFVAEVKVVSHGLLALGGAIALIAGSLLLFSGQGGRRRLPGRPLDHRSRRSSLTLGDRRSPDVEDPAAAA